MYRIKHRVEEMSKARAKDRTKGLVIGVIIIGASFAIFMFAAFGGVISPSLTTSKFKPVAVSSLKFDVYNASGYQLASDVDASTVWHQSPDTNSVNGVRYENKYPNIKVSYGEPFLCDKDGNAIPNPQSTKPDAIQVINGIAYMLTNYTMGIDVLVTTRTNLPTINNFLNSNPGLYQWGYRNLTFTTTTGNTIRKTAYERFGTQSLVNTWYGSAPYDCVVEGFAYIVYHANGNAACALVRAWDRAYTQSDTRSLIFGTSTTCPIIENTIWPLDFKVQSGVYGTLGTDNDPSRTLAFGLDAYAKLCGDSPVKVVPHINLVGKNNQVYYTNTQKETLDDGTEATMTMTTNASIVGFLNAKQASKFNSYSIINSPGTFDQTYKVSLDRSDVGSSIKKGDPDTTVVTQTLPNIACSSCAAVGYMKPGLPDVSFSTAGVSGYPGNKSSDTSMPGYILTNHKAVISNITSNLTAQTPVSSINQYYPTKWYLPNGVKIDSNVQLQPLTTMQIASENVQTGKTSYNSETKSFEGSGLSPKYFYYPWNFNYQNVYAVQRLVFQIQVLSTNKITITSNGETKDTSLLGGDTNLTRIVNSEAWDEMEIIPSGESAIDTTTLIIIIAVVVAVVIGILLFYRYSIRKKAGLIQPRASRQLKPAVAEQKKPVVSFRKTQEVVYQPQTKPQPQPQPQATPQPQVSSGSTLPLTREEILALELGKALARNKNMKKTRTKPSTKIEKPGKRQSSKGESAKTMRGSRTHH